MYRQDFSLKEITYWYVMYGLSTLIKIICYYRTMLVTEIYVLQLNLACWLEKTRKLFMFLLSLCCNWCNVLLLAHAFNFFENLGICRYFRHSASVLPVLQMPVSSIPLGSWVPSIGDRNCRPIAMLRPSASLSSALSLLVQGCNHVFF